MVQKVSTNPVAEDFRAAAGNRGDAGFFEFEHDITQGLFCRTGNLYPFDGGEGFYGYVRAEFFDGFYDVQIIGVRELWVDASYHVDFCDGNVEVAFDALLDVFRPEDVAPVIFGGHVEGAEFTEFVADVGVVDVLVTHVPGHVATHAFADDVG